MVTRIFVTVLALSAQLAHAAAFTPGNLAVLRVGEGSAALTNACTAIFVDEYSPSGALVQSIALPTADSGANNSICLSGTATSEGFMTRTGDGQALVVAGYDAVPGTALISTAAGINRVVAIIAADGTVDTSNNFIDGFLTNNVRGAAATSPAAIYLSGTGSSASGGTRLLNAGVTTTTQISTTVTNTRALGIFAGQLFSSTQSGAFRMASVGTGLPTTSGQTTTNLPGFATATTSPYQFVFADLDANVAGLDTLWVANDDATALQKHSFNGATWTPINSVGASTDAYRGLTRIGTTLYATGRASSVGVIRSLAAGDYNVALSGVPTTLVTATTNRVFQGIAATPEAAVVTTATVSINSNSILEGNAGTSNLTFTVTRSNNTTAFMLPFTVANGTTNASDYTLANGTLTFAAGGALTQSITAVVNGDSAVEPDETFTVTLGAITNTTGSTSIANGMGTGTIQNDDTVGVSVLQSGGSTDVTEGGTSDSFAVALNSQPSADVVIGLSATQLTVAPTSLSFTSANWDVPQTVTVTAIDDNLVEGPHFGSVTSATTSQDTNYNNFSIAALSVAISDNDLATLSFAPASVTQSEASSPMAFTVTLSNPVASGVTVTANTANGSASALDFTAVSAASVTFPANSTAAQTISVVINNDALDENDESFTLNLTNLVATGAVTLGTASATGTILDDDALPVLSVANVSVAEGNAGTTAMNFVVNLTPASGRDVSFTRVTADGTATVANNDYVALTANVLTIPAGQTSVNVAVLINGDTAIEGAETLSLNLSAPVAATPSTISAIGTIIDDDQQPTTTTIVSDLTAPSVVGQSYAVNVQVAGASASPLGMVNVSDGLATCTITLTATANPNSAGSCNLTSTTAGNKTITASYVPADTSFGASSTTTLHLVNAASTTLTLTGPATLPLNQSASYSFTLAVSGPGAGAPAGTVTVQSGAQNCQVTVPSASTSCTISYTTVGNKTVSASFAPSNSNFVASNTSSNVSTLVFARSDLSVSKSDGVSVYRPNDLLVYTIGVRNAGPDAAQQLRLVDAVPASLNNVTWNCTGTGGAVCPSANGIGSINEMYANLPVNGQLSYTLSGSVIGSPPSISNTATLVLPSDGTVVATVPANLSASDTDLLDLLFRNGFEDPIIIAVSGSSSLPSSALSNVLDGLAQVVFSLDDVSGEALRVYSRRSNGDLQFALALRDDAGRLRLASWQRTAGIPILVWRAEPVFGGYQLQLVELR